MRRRAFILVGVLACGGPPLRQSPEPGRGPLSPGATIEVSAGPIRHFPFAFEVGPQVLVSYSQHADGYIADPVDAMTAVAAGGAVGATVQAANFYVSGMAAIAGALYGASYITSAMNDAAERSHGWTSGDQGRTWQPQPGVVHLPAPPKARAAGWGGLLFHRRLHVLGGSLVGTLYGNYESDGDWYRTVWAISADLGKNWNVVSTIAAGAAGTEGYGEPVSAFCADGRILVVMRTGPTSPMRMTRSSDQGLSWEPPTELAGKVGWDPDLLAASGAILLSYGLPGQIWVDRSPDCGSSWREGSHLEVPTSSGYTGLAHVDGAIVVFTDSAGESKITGFSLPELGQPALAAPTGSR